MLRILPVLVLLLLLTACGRYQPTTGVASDIDPNALSERYLTGLKAGEDVSDEVDQLANLDPGALAGALDTRDKRLAFWVNTYNGMVQYLLTEDPSLYDDRSSFFSTPSFTVAGRELSPNDNRARHHPRRGEPIGSRLHPAVLPQ